jgi:hypothetical protein
LASFIVAHKEAIVLWVGALCTFGIYSVLYKENPYYRICEHIFIGLASGLGIFVTWNDTLKPKWWDPMVNLGQWWWALALAGGLMFYFIYSPRNGWISKLMMGMLMGLGAGQAFQGFANMYFPMISGSFKPIIPTTLGAGPGVSLAQAANNLVFVFILVTVMAYFFFSIDHKAKSMRVSASLGRWFLMFAFGAMFGATVMARMALFIGRLDFLTTMWAPIVPLWFWIAVGAAILAAVGYRIFRPKPPMKNPDDLPGEPDEVQPVTQG